MSRLSTVPDSCNSDDQENDLSYHLMHIGHWIGTLVFFAKHMIEQIHGRSNCLRNLPT